MQDAVHKNDRPNGAAMGVWRLAILASFGGLALTVLALPVDLESGGLIVNPALAANDSSNAGGNGNGPESVSGQQQTEDFADSEESGGSAEEPAIKPIAEDKPANTNVIKEIAGLAGDAELSEEEELEAIRSGWGTWRTADGPETVVAQ